MDIDSNTSFQPPSALGITSAAAASTPTASAPPSSQPNVSFDMTVNDSGKSAASAAPSSSSDFEQHKRIEGQLHSLRAALQAREPLDATYDSLIPVSFRKHAKSSVTISKVASTTTSSSSQKSSQSSTGRRGGGGGGDGTASKQNNKKSNVMPADVKLHRRLNANLRGIVEKYASTPAGWRRKPNTRRIDIDFGSSSSSNSQSDKGGDHTTTSRNINHDEKINSMLRAAFALRESKEHEQRDLVNATLQAENSKLYRGWGFTPAVSGAGMMGVTTPMVGGGALPPFEEASVRKKRLDGIVKQLRDKEKCLVERAKWTKIAERGKELVRFMLRLWYISLINRI